MAQVSKKRLSGSTDGRQIKVVATATPGTLIHTAVTGTVAGTWDEIWVYAHNADSVDRLVVFEIGGVTSPDDTLQVTIPQRSGRYLVLDGAILQNGTVLRCFCTTTAVIMISGHVNAILA